MSICRVTKAPAAASADSGSDSTHGEWRIVRSANAVTLTTVIIVMNSTHTGSPADDVASARAALFARMKGKGGAPGK